MNSGSVFAAVLIAINVITLSLMAPLNSLILAHLYEPVLYFLSLHNLRGWDTRGGFFPVFGELVGK